MNQKLRRMCELQVLIRLEDETDLFEYCDEYRALLTEVLDEYSPLIKQLVQAGIFTVYHQHKEIGYEVSESFNNGNIWLVIDDAGITSCRTDPKSPKESVSFPEAVNAVIDFGRQVNQRQK